MTLSEIRKQIDDIDKELKKLFIKRMAVSDGVATIKAETGDKILKPQREVEVIKNLTADVDSSIVKEYTSFLKKVMEVSRKYQYGKVLTLTDCFNVKAQQEGCAITTVSYQGIPCSYSESSAKAMFPTALLNSQETFEGVFEEVAQKKSQVGVVPLENSTAGSVYEVYDLLLHYDLYMNDCYIKKVDHCLAAIEESALEDIKTAYSHPQAIAQSSEFLKVHGIVGREDINTAVAAQKVAQGKDKTVAAICSCEAARRYGLVILKESINHSKENATKFVGISPQLIAKKDHNKIAIAFTCPHKSGSLAAALGIFADYEVNLTEIHSRPDGKSPWNYMFYVDFTGNLLSESTKALLFQLTEELPFLKILGSYTAQV